MTELSPDAENLIASASGGDEPSAFDEERVRTKLAGRLALAAATVATTATAPAQALSASAATIQATASASSLMAAGAVGGAGLVGSAKAGFLLSSKLVLVLALGGGATVVGAQYLGGAPSDSSVSRPVVPRADGRRTSGGDQKATPNQAPPPSPIQHQTIAQSEATPPPGGRDLRSVTHKPALPSETRPSGDAVPSTASAPTSPSGPATLSQVKSASFPVVVGSVAEEAALLRQARFALASGATVKAARLLEQHRVRFPQGALIEERTATEVMVHCANGRNAATDRRAAEFLRAYPHSPLANPVRQACARNERQDDSGTDP